MSKNEVKEISIQDLIKNYIQLEADELKDKYLHSAIITNNYIDYGTKCFLANNIIEQCSKKDGFVHLDSCKKYIMYIYTMIKYYTNIHIDEKDVINTYDRLESIGLIDKILELIPLNEQKSFSTILQMKQDDFMTNEYEIHACIENMVKNFYPVLSKQIKPILDSLDGLLSSLDDKKIMEIMKEVSKLQNK